jgi:ADP-dependent NAD(P)H-hydrate dehydratase / NAD(P)H-hydrate epimerase
MKALTAAEMREVDRLTTERFDVSGLALMESAGKSVAEVFLEQYTHKNTEPPGRICVLCGKGNNGGDGFVVARHLLEEAEHVEVYLFAPPEGLRGDAAINFERWREQGGRVTLIQSEAEWEQAWPQIAAAEVIFDALLGTGIRGAASGLVAQAIEDLNRLSQNATMAHPAWIVAVDTPSGLPSDGEAAAGPVVRAHLMVTFTAPKIGQLNSPDAACCGQLVVRPIGSPAALVEEIGKSRVRWAGPDEFAGLPLVRAAEAHKGSYGHVLLVAGSVGKTGAAVLAGQAALRGGAGLVTLATPEPALATIAAAQPEYMTEPLPSTASGTIAAEANSLGRFAAALHGKTVLAIGPGVGTHPETQEFVRSAVAHTDLPIVLDADGLNAFAGYVDLLPTRKSAHLVLTPHPGEMARLLGVSSAQIQESRVQTALEAARQWNAHVVLKGFHTVLASPAGEVFINTTGNAALAKGGSGDVLTGLLAAVIGQFGTRDFLRVLALGVYLHGLAAELLSQQSDASGILAGEVAHAIPFARRTLLQELQERA